jgi:hypothetical protein
MGMDVIGRKPRTQEGEWFRINAWWWHPLADYCQQVATDVAAGCKYWHSNDGDGLDEVAQSRNNNAGLRGCAVPNRGLADRTSNTTGADAEVWSEPSTCASAKSGVPAPGA